MRRWKVISGYKYDICMDFHANEILLCVKDDNTGCPLFRNLMGEEHYFYLHDLTEIDENGNTIRTYKEGDKLDEGTLVGGTMNKSEAMKRLDAIEAEARALRVMISQPDHVQYEHGNLYGAIKNGVKYLMVYSNTTYSFASFNSVSDRWSDHEEAQDSINNMIENGGKIFVFNNKEDAFQFMLTDN